LFLAKVYLCLGCIVYSVRVVVEFGLKIGKSLPLGVLIVSAFFEATGIVKIITGILYLLGVVGEISTFFVGDIAGAIIIAYGFLLLLVGWGLGNFRLWAFFLALMISGVSIPLALMYNDLLTTFVYSFVAVTLVHYHKYYFEMGFPKPETKIPITGVGHYVKKTKDLGNLEEYRFVRKKER